MPKNPRIRIRDSSPLLHAAAWTAVGAAALLLCATAVNARAGDSDAGPREKITRSLYVDPTALATPEGRQEVLARARAAIARMCASLRDSSSIAFRETEAECRKDALAAAMEQIEPRSVLLGKTSVPGK